MKAAFKEEGFNKRLGRLTAARKEADTKVEKMHVRIQKGNSKTGANCYTVSLLPVIDCKNCGKCKNNCYDLKNDMMYPRVITDRARNSAIHSADPVRYWHEIDMQIKLNYVQELRLNVGGDLTDNDFAYVARLGKDNPRTQIMFFTKNYKGINKFLDNDSFPENVHPIMSAWQGMKMDNPHNLPCSHVLYEDGKTTAPLYGAYFCQGNCSKCAFNGEGCWNLKNGEHVIFKAH